MFGSPGRIYRSIDTHGARPRPPFLCTFLIRFRVKSPVGYRMPFLWQITASKRFWQYALPAIVTLQLCSSQILTVAKNENTNPVSSPLKATHNPFQTLATLRTCGFFLICDRWHFESSQRDEVDRHLSVPFLHNRGVSFLFRVLFPGWTSFQCQVRFFLPTFIIL